MGGKLSRLVYLALPPPPPNAQDLGQAVSSVNSYCTIILEYLVVRDINIILVKLTCFIQHSVWLPLSEGWGASSPGWFILPPAQDLGQTVTSVNSYCTIILEYLVVWDINIISVKLDCFHPMFSLVILDRGGGGGEQAVQAGLSCFPPPPAQDLGQAVSSVNCYWTIILEYLVVRDINIISVKLRYLHPTFSLVTLVRGVGWGGGASCPGCCILPPAQDLSQAVSSVNSYCTITLEYLVVRDVNIISVKLRCLHLMFSSVILVRGVGGKLYRLVYLALCPGFESGSVISQFLLHYNLGIFSCKRCEHYFSQTEMFTSNVQFGYPCLRGGGRGSGGQAVQAGLSCPPPRIWVKQCHHSVNSYCTIILQYLVVRDVNVISAKLDCGLSILYEILGGGQDKPPWTACPPPPHPLSIRNPTENLK